MHRSATALSLPLSASPERARVSAEPSESRSHHDHPHHRRARGRRAAAAHRRRLSRAEGADDAREARVGRRSTAITCGAALMLEPRGHADMYGALLTEPVHAGLARRRAVHAQRGLQHDVRPRRHRGRHDRARARAASCPARTDAIVLDAPAGTDSRRGARRPTPSGRARPVASSFLNVPSFVLHGGLAGSRSAARRCAPTSRSAARSTRSSTARRWACRSCASASPSCAASAWRSSAIEAALQRRAPARAAAARGHLRHDLHRPAERRTPICATSRLRRRRSRSLAVRHRHGAVMAVLDAMGLLGDDRPFVHESLIGTRFTGRIERETTRRRASGDRARTRRRGLHHGTHSFVIDPADPLRQGFRL